MSGGQKITITPGMIVSLRAFRDEDYPRLAEIRSLAFPDDPWSAEEIRGADASWDHTRHEFVRVVAEDADGHMVGVGRISHEPWEFHPRGYSMNITVEPALRRHGIGTTIYDGLIAELRRRGAVAVHTWVAMETMTESIAFLWHRGFVEVQRGWQSCLNIAAFDLARFAGAEERVAARGISRTTRAARQPAWITFEKTLA